MNSFIVKCYNVALLMSNYTWTELSLLICLSKNVLSVLHNGNWIEWSAIWSEIICMTLKLDMRAVRVQFEITTMSSDQNLATWSSITTLLEPFWNHKIQSVPIWCWSSSRLAGLLKINLKSKAWFQMKIARYLVQLPLHYNHFEIAESSQYQFFVFKTEMVRFRTEMMWFRTWMIRFWTDVI